MYTSLMGTFDIPSLINYLGMTNVGKNVSTVVGRTDLWGLPSQDEPQSEVCLLLPKPLSLSMHVICLFSLTCPFSDKIKVKKKSEYKADPIMVMIL